MLMLVALASASSSFVPQYSLPPTVPSKVERCSGRCAARYRLPAATDGGVSAKDRALGDDGSKCDVVGARRCGAGTHTILRSGEDPIDTWRSALRNL